MFLLHDISAVPIFRPESTENGDVPDVEDFDDDASQFTTASINSAPEGDISNHRGALAGAEQNEKGSSKDDENSVNLQNLRPCNASAALSRESVPGIPEVPPPPPNLEGNYPIGNNCIIDLMAAELASCHLLLLHKG